jgi:FkbM family methyltransferase
MTYYSQANQDKWVCEFLNFKQNGFYLDIGAYDGIQTSNTFVLEKDLNWSGICVEANSEVFNTLSLNRKSKNLNLAVLDYKGYCSFYRDSVRNDNIGNLTPCDTLNNILEQNDAPSIIDYMSIDIEGSEFNALKDFDFKKWQINLITIEHNLYVDGDFNKNRLFKLLSENNFERVFEDVVCLDTNPNFYQKPYEDWYVNKNIL